MDKKARNLAIAFISLIVVLGTTVALPKFQMTGQQTSNLPEKYTHTKALCNENNFCQDYKITCKNETIQKTTPITGATIQHSKDWEDPRKNPEKLC